MRFTIRFFAVLDFVSIGFMTLQVLELFNHSGEMPDELISKFKVAGTLLVYISLFFSAAGLPLLKKWACIVYYIQFPVRMILWVFSFGFITLIPETFEYYGDAWFPWLFRFCIVAEFFRLYFTARFHQSVGRR